MKEDTIIKNKAFGVISLNKVYHGGGRHKLFGSSVDNISSVKISVSRAELQITDLGEEKVFHSGLPIVTLELSPTQFSELLLSGNVNDGVACTLTKINGETIPPISPLIENKKERLQNFYRDKMKATCKKIEECQKEVKKILSKSYISQGDRGTVIGIFEKLEQDLSKNMPFYLELFQENMDKITAECKTEIDASFQALINKVGVESLKKMGVVTPNNPLAIENKEEE